MTSRHRPPVPYNDRKTVTRGKEDNMTASSDVTLGFIGFGNMAQAMACGLVEAGALPGERIWATAAHFDKLQKSAGALGAHACETAAEVIEASDFVVVAVKPHLVAQVLEPVRDALAIKAVISVAAGCGFDFYEDKMCIRDSLTPDIVREISAKKDEPAWMLDFRLKSLETYQRLAAPDWGPALDGLDMDHIVTYVKPNTDQQSDWDSLPDDVKNTFDRLGIPEAERAYLAGVGAQYDSELVYHNMQKTASDRGIVYSGIEEALHDPQWEPLIRSKFMTLIPPTDHKFAALHGAVWSLSLIHI